MYDDTIKEKEPGNKSGEQDTGWSHGRYTVKELDEMYGLSSESQTEVDKLGQRVNVNDVRRTMDADEQLSNEQILGQTVNENATQQDVRSASQMAMNTMTELGVDKAISQREVTSRAIAEQLSNGRTERGELHQENRRDVAEAMVAQQFADELSIGNTETLKRLDVWTGNKVMALLWELRHRHGKIESVPNDDLAVVGELIMRAEKSATTEGAEASQSSEVSETPQMHTDQSNSIEEARRLVEEAHQYDLAA